MKVVIIDPASTETIHLPYCYSPYFIYAALRDANHEILLFENFTVSHYSEIPNAHHYVVALWSYPQIEAAIWLYHQLPGPTSYTGYWPLIDLCGLPKWSDTYCREGLASVAKYYSDFKYIFSDDCHTHLTRIEQKPVIPLWLSYGCSHRCSFCPSAANTDGKCISLSLPEARNAIDIACEYEAIIHFHDDDFFQHIDLSAEIIKYLSKKKVKYFALASQKSFSNALTYFGENQLSDSGLSLVEVGLESADLGLQKAMGKPNSATYLETIMKAETIPKFWLAVTFFPGETLRTLNRTGAFMQQYGYSWDELVLPTNSSLGGLGQFFQPYHGTVSWQLSRNHGYCLTERPIRIVPSFLPDSFLEDRPTPVRDLCDLDYLWLSLYKHKAVCPIDGTQTIRELIQDQPILQSIYLAVLARTGAITSAKQT